MKLDIGCGTQKKADHIGVDRIKFDGVDVVCDIGKDRWPFDDGSVDEIHASHVFEHLVAEERIHAINEACRVLKKSARICIITPHWCSPRAYGDLTHVWPPVSEWWFFYLDADWRKVNAPHESRYTCDFGVTAPGYAPHASLTFRSAEYQQFALQNYKGAADDMAAVLIKK